MDDDVDLARIDCFLRVKLVVWPVMFQPGFRLNANYASLPSVAGSLIRLRSGF